MSAKARPRTDEEAMSDDRPMTGAGGIGEARVLAAVIRDAVWDYRFRPIMVDNGTRNQFEVWKHGGPVLQVFDRREDAAKWVNDQIVSAVAAHLLTDAVVELAYRAFTLEIFRQDGQPPPDLDKQFRETAPADLRKVEATMRAALAAAVGEPATGAGAVCVMPASGGD